MSGADSVRTYVTVFFAAVGLLVLLAAVIVVASGRAPEFADRVKAQLMEAERMEQADREAARKRR